jgi:DUF971 family protein
MAERVPTQIKLHQKSRVMEIAFADGRQFQLPYEYLRVYSPSAEVRGHGPGQEVLQTGKRTVEVRALEPVGSYPQLWAEYLAKLESAGGSRDK